MRLELLQERRCDYAPMIAKNLDLSTVYSLGEKADQAVEWKVDFDLADLIRALGGTIHYIDYADFRQYEKLFENSIYVHENDRFDILLPAYATSADHRYTLAHELGHYLLHRKEMTFACRSGETQIEKESDCFALGFLMPKAVFEPYVERHGKSVRLLSIAFQVPEFAVQSRLRSLALD